MEAEPVNQVGASELGPVPDAMEAPKRDYEQLATIAGNLTMLAQETIGLRQTVEERWLEDLRQYNGEYEASVMQTLQSNESSQLFVNITRPKTRTIEARLVDMLFGSDDRNFSLRPTPHPEVSSQLDDGTPSGFDENGEPLSPQAAREQESALASDAAEAMETEVADQLAEAQFGKHARLAIHDATTLGTGVIKGPVVVGRTRKTFRKVMGPNGPQYEESVVRDVRPATEYVDVWNFFPDMGAASIDEARFVFERGYLTSLQMKQLMDDPYYDEIAIMDVLKLGAQATQISRNPTQEKRDSTGDQQAQQTMAHGYEVWTYWGPLTYGELRAAGVEVPNDKDYMEAMACVVMSGNSVLKAFISPEDRLPYAVFNYETDEASIFGYGLPRRIRSSQIGLNAAVRALMDNAGLSVGPQYIFNDMIVEPVDGDYRLKPKKGWRLTDRNRSVNEVFRTIDLSAHHGELMNLVQMWSRFADEESGIPLIAQGEQGQHVTKTAQGMAMLMNSANVIVRSIVRNWDDGVTIPVIRGFYSWNMKFSAREDIKGDFEVDARGSSVLVAKEVQSQNLMTLASNFAAHPVFGPMTKHAELYRKTVRAMSLPADEVIYTDAELESAVDAAPESEGADPAMAEQQAMQQQAQAQAEQQAAEVERKAQADLQKAQLQHQMAMEKSRIEHDSKIELAMLQRETTMMQVAANGEMKLEEIRAMLQEARIRADAQIQSTQIRAAT